MSCVAVSNMNVVESVFYIKSYKFVLCIAIWAAELLVLVLIIQVWTFFLFHSR